MAFGCTCQNDEPRKFEFSWQVSSKKLASAQNAYGFAITEYDHLTGIFNGVISAPVQLLLEPVPANQSFDVPFLAADNTAICSRLRLEKLSDP